MLLMARELCPSPLSRETPEAAGRFLDRIMISEEDRPLAKASGKRISLLNPGPGPGVGAKLSTLAFVTRDGEMVSSGGFLGGSIEAARLGMVPKNAG